VGCAETRVVHWNPPLARLEGASAGRSIVDGRRMRTVDPATAVQQGELRTVDDAGRVILRARTSRHLMIHIYNTLQSNDADLFVDQVLSAITREEYIERGLNPRRAFLDLKRQERAILSLFNLMPAGESTPGVTWRNVGRVGRTSIVRVEASGPVTQGYDLTYMDMALENGSWRLRWFGPNRRTGE